MCCIGREETPVFHHCDFRHQRQGAAHIRGVPRLGIRCLWYCRGCRREHWNEAAERKRWWWCTVRRTAQTDLHPPLEEAYGRVTSVTRPNTRPRWRRRFLRAPLEEGCGCRYDSRTGEWDPICGFSQSSLTHSAVSPGRRQFMRISTR